ncbi:hypothetical protein H1P_310013 [Hyella patelloides LEGE 07179]|uniref:Uncharacterized protein n=1 Tax=Hyella patelloides LEGE 07179 TaxID=945734 RepID=A0A563VUG4_9CYAN|nr:hypothetical protein H1P_310013 [Hyella patelloides LEGE 07179]
MLLTLFYEVNNNTFCSDYFAPDSETNHKKDIKYTLRIGFSTNKKSDRL